jgi:subtilase family serine protease
MASFTPHTYIKHPMVQPAVPWLSIRDICASYNWPKGLVGGGVIGIVECGGGWVAGDTAMACSSNQVPVPMMHDVSMDLSNTFGQGDADFEVALDIQVAAIAYSVATGKAAQIKMYWSQDIEAGVTRAAADGCDVCSISWGADEAQWGKAAAKSMNKAAAAAVAKGMLVFAASGDNDSSDGGQNAANVDCPASCPSIIGCGGTNKTSTTEVVWNNNPGDAHGSGTGGGYSTVFTPMPLWQAGAPHGPGRIVPDVAGNADPDSGYPIWLHGKQNIVGGTSAVAPLYAGLFAAFGHKLANGLIQKLYLNHMCFHDITAGDNGMFRARVGPDACTGLGSPIGIKLAALTGAK